MTNVRLDGRISRRTFTIVGLLIFPKGDRLDRNLLVNLKSYFRRLRLFERIENQSIDFILLGEYLHNTTAVQCNRVEEVENLKTDFIRNLNTYVMKGDPRNFNTQNSTSFFF